MIRLNSHDDFLEEFIFKEASYQGLLEIGRATVAKLGAEPQGVFNHLLVDTGALNSHV